MNNLSQSNIAQLCSIVVCDLFAIYIGNRLYHNKDYGRESWNDFPETCKRKCLFQSTLSLVWPTSKKVKAEWTILIESTAERLAKATIEKFLLGIREEPYISKIYEAHRKL